MLPPKTSHHAKFHRDRSNQLGEKRLKALPFQSFPTFFVTDGQKLDYLSRVSHRARGTTKKAWMWVIAMSPCRCQRHFWALPVIAAAR